MSKAITITNPSGVTLKTKNKYMDDDVAVQVDGAENIVASNIKNGVSILGVEGTLPAAPSGTLSITENGTYDVSGYENVTVEIGGGKMWLHKVVMYKKNLYDPSGSKIGTGVRLYVNVFTTDSTPITFLKFMELFALASNGPSYGNGAISGTMAVDNKLSPIVSASTYDGDRINLLFYNHINSNWVVNRFVFDTADSVSDTITEV